MKKFIFIFSHKPTELQIEDAKKTFGVDRVVVLPDDIVKLYWSKIPPELESVDEFLNPVKEWLKENSKKDDIVLVQGDFGATFLIVRFCFDNELIPVYSTTERTVIEKHDKNGKVDLIHSFKHKRYRLFEKYFGSINE